MASLPSSGSWNVFSQGKAFTKAIQGLTNDGVSNLALISGSTFFAVGIDPSTLFGVWY